METNEMSAVDVLKNIQKKAEETKIETGEASSQKGPAKAETEEKKEKPAADEDKTE